MKRELDCRDMICPAPVMQVRDSLAVDRPASIVVMVDNEAARENVSRFLTHHGYQVHGEEKDSDFMVTGVKNDGVCQVMSEEELASVPTGGKKILVMLTTDRMGHGDDSLGAGLMLNFIKTLKEMGPELWRLVMVNSGVKLAVEGAETLAVLQEHAASGVSILVCGTCLNHFKLLDKKQVGEITNMLDIVTSLQVADQVINI